MGRRQTQTQYPPPSGPPSFPHPPSASRHPATDLGPMAQHLLRLGAGCHRGKQGQGLRGGTSDWRAGCDRLAPRSWRWRCIDITMKSEGGSGGAGESAAGWRFWCWLGIWGWREKGGSVDRFLACFPVEGLVIRQLRNIFGMRGTSLASPWKDFLSNDSAHIWYGARW